jgi:hypothetical protein
MDAGTDEPGLILNQLSYRNGLTRPAASRSAQTKVGSRLTPMPSSRFVFTMGLRGDTSSTRTRVQRFGPLGQTESLLTRLAADLPCPADAPWPGGGPRPARKIGCRPRCCRRVAVSSASAATPTPRSLRPRGHGRGGEDRSTPRLRRQPRSAWRVTPRDDLVGDGGHRPRAAELSR